MLDNDYEGQVGDGHVNLDELELLNRNEFFAKRHGTRTGVPKISIIFRGDDDVHGVS